MTFSCPVSRWYVAVQFARSKQDDARFLIGERESIWQRWMFQPQTAWLRGEISSFTCGAGFGIGLYVLLVA